MYEKAIIGKLNNIIEMLKAEVGKRFFALFPVTPETIQAIKSVEKIPASIYKSPYLWRSIATRIPASMSSTPEHKDFELFQQVSTGDRRAFRLLFDRYYKYLVVTSYNIQGDADKARDLAQDVFLELWKKRSEIHITSSLKSYLRRAVFNKTLNYIKAQRLDFKEDETMPVQSDKSANAQQMLEKEDLQELINHAIESLPGKCRLVFTLCRLEQLSHKEISQKLNISTKTVENQMTKALKVLRTALQSYMSEGLMLLAGLVGNCFVF